MLKIHFVSKKMRWGSKVIHERGTVIGAPLAKTKENERLALTVT